MARSSSMESERAKACLAKAAECERKAVLAAEETARKTYQDLAHQWRHMAEQAEDLDRQFPDWQFRDSADRS